MAFVHLLPISRCRPDRGVFLECGGKELAVFATEGGTSAVVLDNSCPHASGNLSAGSIAGGCVACPVHQWNFDVQTGFCPDSPKARVRVYPAEVRDGVIWADLG